MKKLVCILFIITVILNAVLSQEKYFGLKFDVNGEMIFNQLNPLTYSPEKRVQVIHNSSSFEKGAYYTLNGEKVDGYIKYENKKFWFKMNKDDSKLKMEPENIKAIVIGIDSFFVTSGFTFRGVLRKNPELIQYIAETDNYTLCKYYHFSSDMAQGYLGADPLTISYLIQNKSDGSWETVPSNRNEFEKYFKTVFSIDYLNDKEDNKQDDTQDEFSYIKRIDYQYRYKTGQLIYFDRYWNELRDMNKFAYYGQIKTFSDSLLTISYYNSDRIKIYEIDFKSVYPFIKHGESKEYDSLGRIKQVTLYKDDLPQQLTSYYENGITQFVIDYSYTNEDVLENYYVKTLNDSTGSNILIDGSTQYNLRDELCDRTCELTISNNQFEDITFKNFNYTFHQLCNPVKNYNISALKNSIKQYFNDHTYDEAIMDDAQGYILISILVNDKGMVITSKSLNKLHPQIDKLVNDYLWEKLSIGTREKMRLKRIKLNESKLYYEVIIPIEFSINRFYRPQRAYYYDNMWQMRQMQMQMQPKFNIPNTPF